MFRCSSCGGEATVRKNAHVSLGACESVHEPASARRDRDRAFRPRFTTTASRSGSAHGGAGAAVRAVQRPLNVRSTGAAYCDVVESSPRTVAEHVAAVLALVAPLPAREVPLVGLVDGAWAGGPRADVGNDDPDGAVRPTPASGVPSVLADDVYAAGPVPAFDHSAMDGYAVRRRDLPPGGEAGTLDVVADIAAAPGEPRGLAPGTAARIMTGAPLPPGADSVVPVERTSTGRFDPAAEACTDTAEARTNTAGTGAAGARTVTLARQPRDHLRRQGEDIATGTLLAPAGSELTAPLVAGLAASGVSRVRVRRRPRVAVVATGSELVTLGSPTGPGQITDSNSLMLATAIRALGADVVRLGPVPDTPDALAAALDDAVGPGDGCRDATGPGGCCREAADPVDACRDAVGPSSGAAGQVTRSAGEGPGAARGPGVDLIVTAGGVSAGAADVVRGLLAGRPGAVSHVEVAAVGMRPGRPQALARWRGVPWIAVPGTPVAAHVSCAMFVRPAVRRLRGLADPGGRAETRPAAVAWSGPRGREQVVPVRVTDRGVEPAGDGHHLSALVAADALAVIPADVEKVAPGDPVPVIPL